MRRLTPATLTLIMFGIVGLLVMGYVAKNLLAVQEKPPVVTLRDVPMAIADIEPGTVVTENHLGMGKYPRDKLDRDVLLVNRVIIGRVAKTPIKSAQPIKANQLYQPGELPPLDLSEGMRAVSIEVGDGVAMVDGMVKPGDFVDILFTSQGGAGVGTSDNTFQGGLTLRLFEGVKILAINRNFTQSRLDRSSNHVTLELTEPQANIIVLARDRGKLTLTYNPNGKGEGGLALSNAERVTLYEILGLKKQDPAKDPFQTEIYRGGSRVTNRFDENGRFWGGGSNSGGYTGWNSGGYTGGGPNAGQYVLPNSFNNPSGVAPGSGNQNGDSPQNNQQPQQPQGQPAPDNQPATRAPTALRLAPVPN